MATTLESMLQDRGIIYEKHLHPTTYTSQDLAKAEHVSGHMVAKPVIVKTQAGFVMCVLPAPLHLDLGRMRDYLGDDEARLASESEMSQLFPNCELGAEAPVGAMFGLRTIMDESLREDAYLVMQSGTHNEAVKMRREDWEQLCTPETAKIACS